MNKKVFRDVIVGDIVQKWKFKWQFKFIKKSKFERKKIEL